MFRIVGRKEGKTMRAFSRTDMGRRREMNQDYMYTSEMPVGNLPLILGSQKGLDVTSCSASIILTTVLCVLSVPVLLMFAG